MPNPPSPAAPRSTTLTGSAVRAYGLAVLLTTAAVALTRFTWPLFAGTPFALLFAAVAFTTHWGSWPAGLLAVLLSAGGARFAFPAGGAGDARALTMFILVAVFASRVIAGRNRTAAALRASEAELRAASEYARESEQKLRRAQKMEAVGQLVAGVAHNFNNLLTVTMGYTDILLERHVGDSDRNDLREIRKATERGAALTRQLLAFGHKHDARLARVDLNGAVASLLGMLTRVIREDIQLTIAAEPAPGAILIDPHDLEQVLVNLVINARDALPDGGAIRIDTARERIDATNGPPDLAVAPGEYVRLRGGDNGIGMTPEVQSHLFEPFFTTKEVGEGTGLGLAFVDGIARHCGGFVAVETAPAKGTTVSVYFPPAPEAAMEAAPEPPTPQTGARPRGATILLVEDEAAVRDLTERMLRAAGHRVLAAATPSQAVALFAEHAGDIDLLLTDIVMPEMHGPVLAQRLVAERPGLPVLFMSGYSAAMPASEIATGTVAFLAKPFSSSRLIAAVGDLLAARTRSA